MGYLPFIPTAAAVIRMLEVAALAAVSTDPVQAVRLALAAAELREQSMPAGGTR